MQKFNCKGVPSDLAQETSDLITAIKPNLDPVQAMLLGPKANSVFLTHWSKLERHVCAAKLAIIREEFAIRFPAFTVATEGFSFGIVDTVSDRYLAFLRPRAPDDIFNMTVALIEDVFGLRQARAIPGIAHYTSNLTQTLQAYCRHIEETFRPFSSAVEPKDNPIAE
jgi:hypothetical protein